MVKRLHESGLKSDHPHLAGIAGIDLSFTGWALTFLAIGNGPQGHDKE
ncbi:hypothetical protein [Micromonospora sp. NPDC005174]